MSQGVFKGVTRRSKRVFGPEGAVGPGEDELAREEPLEIRIQGETICVTMRTPGDDARLAVGFLYSEGIVASASDLGTVAHCGRPDQEGFGNTIEVTPASGAQLQWEKLETSRRGTLTTSACGVCGRRTVEDLFEQVGRLPPSAPVPRALIARAPEILRQHQQNFARTGGVHAAAALDGAGQMLAFAEDVGRHNAVDKVVGSLVQQGRVSRRDRAFGASVLVVSGRASFEIVQKAAMARIPVVASVSAASVLAVDLAERCGMALCTFVRGGGFNLYAGAERIEGG